MEPCTGSNQLVVSRIELAHGSQQTAAGIGIGSTEAEVISAYPDSHEIGPHPYEGGQAKYLRVIAADGSRDVTTLLMETDEDGIVRQVRAGYLDPVRWIEGCA